MALKKLTTDKALDEWRGQVKAARRDSEAAAADTTTEVLVYKQVNIEAAEGDGDRRIKFTASTNAADRTNDVIDQNGWRLEHFLKNPVSLFGHDYQSLPIGKVVQLSPESDRLVATIEFATAEDGNPFADQVFRMVKSGFLKAVSVGFRPLKFAFNEERGGLDFMEQELLELSVVPVPAHQDALVAAGAEADAAMLRAWAEEILQRLDASDDDPDVDDDSPQELTVDAVRALARYPIDEDITAWTDSNRVEPWESDDVGTRAAWTAYEKALRRAQKSTSDLTDEQLSHFLHLVGFDAESEVLREANDLEQLSEQVVTLGKLVKFQNEQLAELKAGRTLSKSNEGKLQQAADLIGDVLNAVKAPPKEDDKEDTEEDAGPEGGPGVDAPTNNVTPDGANPDGQDTGKVPDKGLTWDDDFEVEVEGYDSDEVEIDAELLSEGIRTAAMAMVGDVVSEAVLAAVRSGTGRID